MSGAGSAVPEPPAGLPPLRPMLATPARALPAHQADWAYEVKWDGMRALVYRAGDGPPRLYARSGREVTAQYPELAELGGLLPDGVDCILDTEIVALGPDGTPSFPRLQERMGLHRPVAVRAAVHSAPVTLMAFDVLWLSGRRLTQRPYRERRAELAGLALDHPRVRTPPNWERTGTAAWEWTRSAGLEGLLAKRLDSPYRPGVRSRDWLKIKHIRTRDALIGGWVADSPRAASCQALLLGAPEDAGLRYIGRVGTGFTQRDRHRLAGLLPELERGTAPFTGNLESLRRDTGRLVHWVRPDLACEVEYSEETEGGRLRHPVWRGMRRPPADGGG